MHLSKPLLKPKPCWHKSLVILAIFSFLFLSACKQENKPKETPNLSEAEHKTLNNSEISGKYSVKTLDNSTENLGNLIFDFNSENKTLAVTTDCNNIGASYEISKNKLTFSNAISTRKFCQGAMQNENTISKVLRNIEKFSFSEKELKLLSNDNQILISLIKTEKK
ncbi:META domain-containing protein [Zunongwangia pacifica]|uniref:META domain-containing protein n=1 Tax=Zunongwangia pacifica TaxID=2911062 RepID=A0A9X2CL49_9FLAO|nr:META domain-containing protein [Zunongwangia pacifica]MCL6219646.1 META domain-containing protein [Zunongwangia pacifica]